MLKAYNYMPKDFYHMLKDITYILKDFYHMVKGITHMLITFVYMPKDITNMLKDFYNMPKIITHMLKLFQSVQFVCFGSQADNFNKCHWYSPPPPKQYPNSPGRKTPPNPHHRRVNDHIPSVLYRHSRHPDSPLFAFCREGKHSALPGAPGCVRG